jgi:hypothetical protein
MGVRITAISTPLPHSVSSVAKTVDHAAWARWRENVVACVLQFSARRAVARPRSLVGSPSAKGWRHIEIDALYHLMTAAGRPIENSW